MAHLGRRTDAKRRSPAAGSRRASVAKQTSAPCGRRYLTNESDAESSDLLMMAKDWGSEALGESAAAMTEHGAKPANSW